MARSCGGGYGDGVTCIPGCAPVGQQCLDAACGCWDCSFPPEHLRDALAAQLAAGVQRHNEIIIDTRSVLTQLPDVVVAFYYPGAHRADAHKTWARDAFAAQYGLAPERVPLVRLDLDAPERVFSWG